MTLRFGLVTFYLLKIFSDLFDVFREPFDFVLQQVLDVYEWAPQAVEL